MNNPKNFNINKRKSAQHLFLFPPGMFVSRPGKEKEPPRYLERSRNGGFVAWPEERKEDIEDFVWERRA
jgi:hypothetical protein